jgi:hypothetical protein
MILINLGGTMNTMKYQVVEAREDGSVDEEVREGGSNGNAQQLGTSRFSRRGDVWITWALGRPA